MFLSLFLFSFNSLRLSIPVAFLFGSAPTYFLSWLFLRTFTAISSPSSNELYRRYDDLFFSIYQRFLLFFFENWAPIKIILHGDHQKIFEKKENVLYLSNHQSSVDWIITDMLAIRQGSLGHIRYILKNELKWVPLYGFYFQQHGCIYVRRNDKGDMKRLEKGISQIESNGLPVWLVIFPEGTRFNPINNRSAIQRSKEFAIERGQIPLEEVLYPRSGATIAAIQALKDQLDAIYDVTIMFGQTFDDEKQIRLSAPSMFEYLQGPIKELHIDVRRIDISELRTATNEELSRWLYQRFHLKDQLIKRFYQYEPNKIEQFLCDETDKPLQVELPLRETIFSALFFTLITLGLLSNARGRSFYWKFCLLSTPMTYLWMNSLSSSQSNRN